MRSALGFEHGAWGRWDEGRQLADGTGPASARQLVHETRRRALASGPATGDPVDASPRRKIVVPLTGYRRLSLAMTFTVRPGEVSKKGTSKQTTVIKNGKDFLDVDVEILPGIDPPPDFVFGVTISVLSSPPGADPGKVSEEGDADPRSLFPGTRTKYDNGTVREPYGFPAISIAEWREIDALLVNAGAFTV
jgi:hypothetical protein